MMRVVRAVATAAVAAATTIAEVTPAGIALIVAGWLDIVWALPSAAAALVIVIATIAGPWSGLALSAATVSDLIVRWRRAPLAAALRGCRRRPSAAARRAALCGRGCRCRPLAARCAALLGSRRRFLAAARYTAAAS